MIRNNNAKNFVVINQGWKPLEANPVFYNQITKKAKR